LEAVALAARCFFALCGFVRFEVPAKGFFWICARDVEDGRGVAGAT
jgi:hypothetical protein